MSLNEIVSKAIRMSEEEVLSFLITSVKDIFTTMVMVEVGEASVIHSSIKNFHESVTSMIGFAGTYNGLLSIHTPKALAARFTSGMLGMEADEISTEDMNDALGEIANMLGGYVKRMLSKGGLDLSLSIPTVVVGQDYSVNSAADNDTILASFSAEDDHFLIALSLRKEE